MVGIDPKQGRAVGKRGLDVLKDAMRSALAWVCNFKGLVGP